MSSRKLPGPQQNTAPGHGPNLSPHTQWQSRHYKRPREPEVTPVSRGARGLAQDSESPTMFVEGCAVNTAKAPDL